MPEIPKFPVFNITSKLQEQIDFNLTAGKGDPLAGTGASMPKTLQVQQVTQNANGIWTEVIFDKESPVKDQNQILEKKDSDRSSVVKSYEDMTSVYDTEILDYNTQINQKKQQIISLVNAAVGAGCSNVEVKLPGDGINPLFYYFGNRTPPPPPPLVINGVACGIGSTIFGDQTLVKIYENLKEGSSGSPFSVISTENLSSSNIGKGFENVVSNNTGTSYGRYRIIPTNLSAHTRTVSFGIHDLSDEQKATCVGYGKSILEIAAEIGVLRGKRDQYLEEVNNLKELKNGQEVIKWGSTREKYSLEDLNVSLENSISSLTQFIPNTVTENLIVHFDVDVDSSISSQLATDIDVMGIRGVTKWSSMSGDGLYAEPNSVVYPINLDLADGPSVEINNYTVAANQFFSIQSSFIGLGKIGTGNVPYSIEVWVKITKDSNLGASPTENGATIVGINSTFGYGLQVYKPSGIKVSFGERGNGSLVNSTNLDLNVWYHITATNSSTEGSKIYVNGTLDGSSNSINITSSLDNLQFGYAPNKISQYFSGKISIVRIYNKTLTLEEVTKNYNAYKSRFGHKTS